MTTVDWIILAVIALCALLGLYRGFVATVVYALASLVSLLGAVAAAFYLKEPVGALLTPAAAALVSRSMPNLADSYTSVAATWDEFSAYLQNILAEQGVSLEVLQSSENPQDALVSSLAQPIAQTIAFLVILIAAYFILRLVLHSIARTINLITRLPVLHSLNALLGGILGGVSGLLFCTAVLWACKFYVPAVYSDVGMLSPSVMEQSVIARTLVGWNDGVSLFEPELTLS